MKGLREHRVPLCERATAIVSEMSKLRESEFVFPGNRRGSRLSDEALFMLLRDMGYGHVTTHGFRSSFRDWAAETTNVQSEVAEAALAHVVGDRVEAAYRRGDLFEKRRELMEAWGRFCSGSKAAVVQLRPATAR